MMNNGVLQSKSWSSLWFYFTATMLASLVLLFIVAPLIGMFISTPLTGIREAVADEEVTGSIKLTLMAAFFATAFASIAGVPLAYLLSKRKFRGKSLVLAIIDLPIIIPHSAAGIALISIIGRESLFGKVFSTSLLSTTAGISVAMAFVSIPFLINAAKQAFDSVDDKLEKAARTLGATPFRAFFTISLPLASKGIASGMILMWARGISEFGAVVIIAYHPMTTPVMIFQRFNDFGLAYAKPVAVLLIIICVSIFLLLRFLCSDLLKKDGKNA